MKYGKALCLALAMVMAALCAGCGGQPPCAPRDMYGAASEGEILVLYPARHELAGARRNAL